MNTTSRLFLRGSARLSACLPLLWACGSAPPPEDGTAGSPVGANAGGASAGGAGALGGANVGGSTALGGADPGSAGAAAGSNAAGGASAAGGNAAGGASAAGGNAAGGASAAGGNAAGGASAAGGNAAGGASAAGSNAAGGASAAGSNAAGGASAAGSNAAGGASAAGSNAGGGASAAGSNAGGAASAAGSNAAGTSAGGAGGSTSADYTCTLMIGILATQEWYDFGFESIVDNAKWELEYVHSGFVELWADPKNPVWSTKPSSPCAQNADKPDRIIFLALNFDYNTLDQWLPPVTAVVKNLRDKYPSARRIELTSFIRAPGNMACSQAPAKRSTITPAQDQALAMVSAANPGLVVVTPKFEAKSCSEFSSNPPHPSPAGVSAWVKLMGDYYR